jgi:hypothetical protein
MNVYSKETIKSLAPAVFASSPSNKMTNRYTFVPTDQILEYFDREGWKVGSVRQSGKGLHSIHEIKFRNSQLPKVGDSLLEAVVRNSHNGTCSFSMGAGLFRLVCSNGLTVPTSVGERFTLRHKSFSFDDVKQLADSFSKKLPMIENSVGRMMEKVLTDQEKINFVEEAIKIRWSNGLIPLNISHEEILQPRRIEDQGDDLWKVFNVVQEKMIRGGVSYSSPKGKVRSAREINNIVASNSINTKLCEAAELIL